MSRMLYFRSIIVGTPLEGLGKRIQRLLRYRFFLFRPELTELFREELLLPRVIAKLALRPESSVLDVGAHLGSFLSEVYRIAPHGKHIAIEASPTKATWLRGKFPGAIIKQVAISNRNGKAVFEENLVTSAYSKLKDDRDSTDPINCYEVDVRTIDDLRLHPVSLLKLDIEGQELAAFQGASKFIRSNRPAVIFECGALANQLADRRALFDYITDDLKYQIFTFVDFLYGKGPVEFDEFRKCGIYPFRAFNFIALPLAAGTELSAAQ
jgi:FkbM family methyltransferase